MSNVMTSCFSSVRQAPPFCALWMSSCGMSGECFTRNMNRIFMAVPCIIFIVALVGVPLYFHFRTAKPLQTPCDENLSVSLSNPIFHENGSIENDGDMYPQGHHFTVNGTHRGCLCVLKACIRKCCDKDEYYVKTPGRRSTCVHNPGPSPFDNFSLPVHESPENRVTVDKDHFRVLYGDVCRGGKFILDPEDHPTDKYHLLVDGRFRNIYGEHMDVSKYCLESMNGSEQIRTFVCFQHNTADEETQLQLFLYPLAMIISMPFLLATILVYSILPGLRNLHGKSLVCQCTSLLIAYVGLTIIQMGSAIEDFWCVFLGFMVQFTLLGSFFWLNVMSFDIWWSFSGRRPAKWGTKRMEPRKFLLYSLYAWGVPLIIVAISLAMDFTPSIPDSFVKPDIGKLKCWFADWTASLLYFYLPSGILLVLNTLMFVTTALALRSYNKNEHDKIRFRLYLRLFIIMGLGWTFEVLSFLIGGRKSIWFVTDLSNMLQGVVIFFFFVCKRDVLQKLNQKFCPSWNLFSGKSRERSPSLNSSCDMTKTENDILALTPVDESNGCKTLDTQPPMM